MDADACEAARPLPLAASPKSAASAEALPSSSVGDVDASLAA